MSFNLSHIFGKTGEKVVGVIAAPFTGGASLALLDSNVRQRNKIAGAVVGAEALAAGAYGVSAYLSASQPAAETGLLSTGPNGANIAGFDTGLESSTGSSLSGVLSGAKTGAGVAKDIGGALTIIDALTGRSKKIANTETTPPGWYEQKGGPVTAQAPPIDTTPAPSGGSGTVIGIGLLAVLALIGLR